MAEENNNQIPLAPQQSAEEIVQDPFTKENKQFQPSAPLISDEQRAEVEQQNIEHEAEKQQREKDHKHNLRVQEVMRNFNADESKAELIIAQDNQAKLKQEAEKKGSRKSEKFIQNIEAEKELNKQINELEKHIEYIQASGDRSDASEAKLADLKNQKQSLSKPFPKEEGFESIQEPDVEPAQGSFQAEIDREDEEEVKNILAENKAKADLEAAERKRLQERGFAQKKLDEHKDAIAHAKAEATKDSLELKEIDPNRFWNKNFRDASIGQKILAGLALFMGSAGKGGNSVVALFQKATDRDIESQKLDNKRKLALKKEAWANYERVVNAQQKKIDNADKAARLDILKKEIRLKYLKVQKEQEEFYTKQHFKNLLAKKLSSTGGVSREEMEQLNVENPKANVARRAVNLKNRVYFATNPELAKQLNLKTIPDMRIALRDLGKLKNIANTKTFGGMFDIFSTVPQAEVLVQSVIGNLREPLFGPGVMTDREQELARKIVKNPTKKFSITKANKAALETLVRKLNYGMRARLESAGVILGKSVNEKKIKQIMKLNPDLKKPEAINALIRAGKWDHNEELF